MATVTCPSCKHQDNVVMSDYKGTYQCTQCGQVLRITINRNYTASVWPCKYDLDIPSGLPDDLEKILTEAIACFEIGSVAGSVVLSGLFLEGLLKKAGIIDNRLVDMIKKAHEAGLISALGFHVGTASRLLRNIGAHYSEELAALQASDARLVLEMVRKIAIDIIASGKLN